MCFLRIEGIIFMRLLLYHDYKYKAKGSYNAFFYIFQCLMIWLKRVFFCTLTGPGKYQSLLCLGNRRSHIARGNFVYKHIIRMRDRTAYTHETQLRSGFVCLIIRCDIDCGQRWSRIIIYSIKCLYIYNIQVRSNRSILKVIDKIASWYI